MNNAAAAQIIEIEDENRWNILQKKAQEVRVLQAFRLFREVGMEPILIKGLAVARFYPEPDTRISIDIDLAVSGHEFDAALRLSRSRKAEGLAIDLHRELRHLDTVEWSDLFENSRVLYLDGGSIRVLRPEDHLRVLCVHWLTDGGINKDRLWDVYHMIANRSPDFDWDRFLSVVDNRRRRWLVCTVGLVQRYLGLDLSDTPIADEAGNLPEWLIRTVEREWSRETRPWPLEASLHDRKLLAKQIGKRLRPNPIWATVQMGGSFDAKTRVFYQIGNFFKRIAPSYRRISETIRLEDSGKSLF